jgi:hypothetical protein
MIWELLCSTKLAQNFPDILFLIESKSLANQCCNQGTILKPALSEFAKANEANGCRLGLRRCWPAAPARTESRASETMVEATGFSPWKRRRCRKRAFRPGPPAKLPGCRLFDHNAQGAGGLSLLARI